MMKAKKSFGQHFLKSKSVVSAIISAAELKHGEHVLEIGPGTGVLTEALVQAGARVIAVEADRDLIPALREKFGDTIELVQGDILKFEAGHGDPAYADYFLLPTSYSLIANLPYNIASEVLEKFLSSAHPPTRLVVMVQKEVGERLLAKPGDMSLLSIAVQIYTDPSRVVRVPPGAFVPAPKVDSLVVRLDRNVKCADPEAVIALAKVGFRARRKQLHRNLADAEVLGSEEAKEWLKSRHLSPSARAQELSVEDWITLATRLVL